MLCPHPNPTSRGVTTVGLRRLVHVVYTHSSNQLESCVCGLSQSVTGKLQPGFLSRAVCHFIAEEQGNLTACLQTPVVSSGTFSLSVF